MVNGWAVSDRTHDIDIKTVSVTRRAAIMNWLVTKPKIMVYTHWTDDQIEQKWVEIKNKTGAEVIQVRIEKIEGGEKEV